MTASNRVLRVEMLRQIVYTRSYPLIGEPSCFQKPLELATLPAASADHRLPTYAIVLSQPPRPRVHLSSA